jgi:hypothetical protein
LRVYSEGVSRFLPRCIFAAILCVAVIGLRFPMPATAAPTHHEMSCCAHQAAAPAKKHSGDEPAKTQEDHCCAACAVGLSLFIAPPGALLFRPANGERLIAASAAESSRFDRPPVPPPRAALA